LAQVISTQHRLVLFGDHRFQQSTSNPEPLLLPQDYSIAMLFSHVLCVSLVVAAASTDGNCNPLGPVNASGWCDHGCVMPVNASSPHYGGPGIDPYGPWRCNVTCPDQCSGPGLYGSWCFEDQYGTIGCNNGCNDGYYDGMFAGCHQKCPIHCSGLRPLQDGPPCNRISGRCNKGCEQGYGGDGGKDGDHDSSCELRCSDNCKAPKLFGRWCDILQDCTHGCIDGYYDGDRKVDGPGCLSKCPGHCSGACDKKTGKCNNAVEIGGDGRTAVETTLVV